MASIQHPLLDALREFDTEAARRFPADFDNGLGQMGMLLAPTLENCGYWCTPKNSLTFASTGGEGVHFSFLVQDGKVTESSPVILTVPANAFEPDGANFVVAEDLRNCLRFGFHRGYFALEQLAYDRDLTLEAYSSPDWQPTTLLKMNGSRVSGSLGRSATRGFPRSRSRSASGDLPSPPSSDGVLQRDPLVRRTVPKIFGNFAHPWLG